MAYKYVDILGDSGKTKYLPPSSFSAPKAAARSASVYSSSGCSFSVASLSGFSLLTTAQSDGTPHLNYHVAFTDG